MTMEAYVKSVLDRHPEFVSEINGIVSNEYAAQIEATRAEFSNRVEKARKNWIRNRGEEAYLLNEESIRAYIENTTPRRVYIKSVVLDGDDFEIEIDLLAGTWNMAPVMPKE